MSRTEFTDSLTFLAALQMLKQLVEWGFLSTDEAVRTRKELERRLRPTLLVP